MRKIMLLSVFLLFFCMESAIGENEWFCSECTRENLGNYCGYCGTPKPLWICYECKNQNLTEYCSNCGMHKRYSEGMDALEIEEYENAIGYFEMTKYADYEQHLRDAYYKEGVRLMSIGEYRKAINIWTDYASRDKEFREMVCLNSQINIKPYLSVLGANTQENTLEVSDEFLENIDKVIIMGLQGTCEHGYFATNEEVINILDWRSNNEVPDDIFTEYIEILKVLFGSSVDRVAMERFSDNTYVWIDFDNMGRIFCWKENEHIRIRWYWHEDVVMNYMK